MVQTREDTPISVQQQPRWSRLEKTHQYPSHNSLGGPDYRRHTYIRPTTTSVVQTREDTPIAVTQTALVDQTREDTPISVPQQPRWSRLEKTHLYSSHNNHGGPDYRRHTDILHTTALVVQTREDTPISVPQQPQWSRLENTHQYPSHNSLGGPD